MTYDNVRFDYLTLEYYRSLCREDPYPQPGKMAFDATLVFVCNVRLCYDEETLLTTFGCLDADL